VTSIWDATSLINWYEQIVRRLHSRYQGGEITFRTMAAKLGLSVRELYDLLEQKDLST
jgi:hypothetical protein